MFCEIFLWTLKYARYELAKFWSENPEQGVCVGGSNANIFKVFKRIQVRFHLHLEGALG